MIEYKGISWQIGLIFKAKGSVFPKALMWALPCTAVSLSVSYTHRHLYGGSPTGRENHSTLVSLFAALTSVLGFLICFRTNSAYGRYWEGITLLRIARGEWFNAYSSILSFCSGDADKLELVEAFQHQLARFMSILNCVALQTVTEEFVERFPTLDTCGLDDAGLTFLASKRDPNQRMEILTQWIQRIVVEADQSGLIIVSPPILSRSFQEISRGAVNLTRARNMTEVPFPFPYVQLVTTILVVHSCLMPVLLNVVLESSLLSAAVTFIGTFTFWGMNYISAEIESPFGKDPNALPLHRLQEDFNASLWGLLERRSQTPAKFSFSKARDRVFRTRAQSFSMVNDVVVRASSSQVIASGSVRGSSGSELSEGDDKEKTSRMPKQGILKKLGSISSLQSASSNPSILGTNDSASLSTARKKRPFTEAHSHVKAVLKDRCTVYAEHARLAPWGCDDGARNCAGVGSLASGDGGGDSEQDEDFDEVSVGAGCTPREISSGSLSLGASFATTPSVRIRADDDSAQDAFGASVPPHAPAAIGGGPAAASRAGRTSPTGVAAAALATAATDTAETADTCSLRSLGVSV